MSKKSCRLSKRYLRQVGCFLYFWGEVNLWQFKPLFECAYSCLVTFLSSSVDIFCDFSHGVNETFSFFILHFLRLNLNKLTIDLFRNFMIMSPFFPWWVFWYKELFMIFRNWYNLCVYIYVILYFICNSKFLLFVLFVLRLCYCYYDLFAILYIWSCSKKNDEKKFSKKSRFFKYVSRFKARYKKTTRFTQFTVQVDMRPCKKRKLKNTQYWG